MSQYPIKRSVAKSPASPSHYVPIILFAAIYLATVVIWSAPLWPLAVYGAMSLLTFVAYSIDKSAARQGRKRTSESSLLLLSFVGGWPGAIIAQQALRHKTVKYPFRSYHAMVVALNIAAFLFLVSPWGHTFIELLMAAIARSG